MFEAFYDLSRTPFTREVPVEDLYVSPMLEETLGRLVYAAKRQWFAVVTGDCGTGKTTILRRLAGELKESEYKLLYVADSKLTPRHFYKGILEQLGCEARFYRGDAKRQLHREIELLRGMHQVQPVVVVDEAHLLDREMLEEVRFLLNFRMDAQSPMALVLVGQTELWERLRLQTYAAIRQRIDLQCKLSHYDRAQSAEYLKRHLTYAGAQQDIFSDAAVEEMYRYSGGTARMLNQVATHSLMYGAQNKRRIVDDHMVKQVIAGELS
ncbi:ExeA family protein [Paenibacillus sp. YN15]|uniref:ExeA family protein n=1 Tax=Paenibacillus sp. YN15 TaxID=1742774 RepID=UPI000DCB7667|nr:AAA family ATPase [Paenibacillus sp. YN15]RAU98599.1 AAA family ATPase [Paenibacillus sp. YN15]